MTLFCFHLRESLALAQGSLAVYIMGQTRYDLLPVMRRLQGYLWGFASTTEGRDSLLH